jgi:hypothetical protein
MLASVAVPILGYDSLDQRGDFITGPAAIEDNQQVAGQRVGRDIADLRYALKFIFDVSLERL